MKSHHLSIMSLEEYEPNPEFVGRNFNAGEVIQLVLRAPRTGHWLAFRSVQMVMMHELAHCKQMNHSGAFWAVRNQFAGELRTLWTQEYTGDGFWGRGETLLSGQYTPVSSSADMEFGPRSLCGGTFRSSRGRGRKRKRTRKGTTDGAAAAADKLTYAERQQRRIARKFGTHGVALGDDMVTRVKLENGKRPKGKPRVAGSARGRELRAAAALARFGDQKTGGGGEVKTQAQVDVKAKVKAEAKENENEKKSESESDDYSIEEKEEEDQPALDMNGARLLDPQGNSMVKICEGEDQSDDRVKQEMEELQSLNFNSNNIKTIPLFSA